MNVPTPLRIAVCVSISMLLCFNNIYVGTTSLAVTGGKEYELTVPVITHTQNHGRTKVDRKMIRDRLNQTYQSEKTWEVKHSLPHFYLHIPKTAGYYSFKTLSRILSASPELNVLSIEEKYRICNVGAHPMSRSKGSLLTHHKGVRCNMYMSEAQYPTLAAGDMVPRYAYTVIRNPREHVLSQYFHCAESHDGGKKRVIRDKNMLPLEGWLGTWVMSINDTDKFRENRIKFQCYPPFNLQSRYTGFVPRSDTDDMKLLQDQFTVIGPMDDLDRVLCVTFIHYAGWLPDVCDCSNNTSRGRRLSDHGVTHHGSTYNATRFENALIDKLVENDHILYARSKEIFASQLKVVEEFLGVTICNKIR